MVPSWKDQGRYELGMSMMEDYDDGFQDFKVMRRARVGIKEAIIIAAKCHRQMVTSAIIMNG